MCLFVLKCSVKKKKKKPLLVNRAIKMALLVVCFLNTKGTTAEVTNSRRLLTSVLYMDRGHPLPDGLTSDIRSRDLEETDGIITIDQLRTQA